LIALNCARRARCEADDGGAPHGEPAERRPESKEPIMWTRKLHHAFPLRSALFAGLLLAPCLVGAATPEPSAAAPMSLAQAVALVRSLYPGEVIAAELDTTGDKAGHYHVDVRFAHGATVKFEVDASTRRVTARAEDYDLPGGALTLPEVIALVAAQVPGEVTSAVLDATGGMPAHYHVDVRLASGKVARLRVDARTRAIAWRNAATLDE
jgi:uncharacterized membrane protein YkoI